MRRWRAGFAQTVRQQTVRSMARKDSAGTLPVNCYETKAGDPKSVDFARLAQTEEENSSEQSSSAEVLFVNSKYHCLCEEG